MGKTYVCSDIHGMKGSYEDALGRLNSEDILYILGDATDRGDEGIQILLDIMEHSGQDGKKPQVKYILGNHDLLLIENMETLMKYGVSITSQKDLDDFLNFENLCNQIFLDMPAGNKWNEAHKSIQKVFPQLQNATRDEIAVLSEHLYNDGRQTLLTFMRITDGWRKKMYNFLENSLVQKQEIIDSKRFMLTHSAPIPVQTRTREITLKDVRENDKRDISNIRKDQHLMDYLYARGEFAEKEWKQWHAKGYTTICGHTPERHQTQYDSNLGRLIIDTGCSQNGDMALICIDDGTLQMIGSKGKVNGREVSQEPDKESYKDQQSKIKNIFKSIPKIIKKNRIKAKPLPRKDSWRKTNGKNGDYFKPDKPIDELSAKPSKRQEIVDMKERMKNGDILTGRDEELLKEMYKNAFEGIGVSVTEEDFAKIYEDFRSEPKKIYSLIKALDEIRPILNKEEDKGINK